MTGFDPTEKSNFVLMFFVVSQKLLCETAAPLHQHLGYKHQRSH